MTEVPNFATEGTPNPDGPLNTTDRSSHVDRQRFSIQPVPEALVGIAGGIGTLFLIDEVPSGWPTYVVKGVGAVLVFGVGFIDPMRRIMRDIRTESNQRGRSSALSLQHSINPVHQEVASNPRPENAPIGFRSDEV